MGNTSRLALAYDSVAADYDRHLERDFWMRRALWRHFGRLFHAGDRVLDAGCGTGIDAIHLASRGIQVTAVDISSAMVEQLQSKLAKTSLRSRVDVRTGDIVDVIHDLGPFDGIVSSFAALNTIEIPSFAKEAARVLRPTGRLVAHLLSPGHVDAGSLKRWWRIVRPTAQPDTIEVRIHGQTITHGLLPEDELYCRFFARYFVRRRAYAMGLFIGPDMQVRLPELALDLAARFETRLTNAWPLTSAGRFYVLDLERRRAGE